MPDLTYKLCKVSSENKARKMTTAYISVSDYQRFMDKIKKDKKKYVLETEEPVVLIENQVFYLEVDGNVLNGHIAFNSFHIRRLNRNIGDPIRIYYIEPIMDATYREEQGIPKGSSTPAGYLCGSTGFAGSFYSGTREKEITGYQGIIGVTGLQGPVGIQGRVGKIGMSWDAKDQ